MDLGLRDKVAIVAAASQGLGFAVAEGLAQEGARVAICSRDAVAIARAAERIGPEVLAVPVDVTDAEQVHAFVAAVRSRFGRVDICVTNSGGPPAKTFEQTNAADWESAVRLNLMSTLHFAHAVLPGMKAQGWGRFLTITSVSVKQPLDGLILSNSVRAAVAGLVKSLANEYGAYGVTVNNICPGFTATDRLNTIAGHDPELRDRWASQTALKRIATPEEFANAVVFLASERASYLTGVSLAVDGGLTRGLLG
ncbi:MAG: SDR family oxidoreductase [Bryobacteraceae bacterium]|nr:SDR family oxidoreductase [Bryobacteraceae bacterium]